MNPTEQAALSTLNSGSTTPIMMSKPSPSSPSIADAGDAASVGETGDESLPRSPRPSNGSLNLDARASRGTSHSVLSPAPAERLAGPDVGRRRCDADVTQLFRALRDDSSPSRSAVLTGAQKWLREPASLNASVLRCAPLAAACRTSRGPSASSTAVPQ